jgi:hypothetical protein
MRERQSNEAREKAVRGEKVKLTVTKEKSKDVSRGTGRISRSLQLEDVTLNIPASLDILADDNVRARYDLLKDQPHPQRVAVKALPTGDSYLLGIELTGKFSKGKMAAIGSRGMGRMRMM